MAWPWPTFPVQGSRLVSEFRGDYNQMQEAMLSAFTGPDAPAQTFPGMWWVDNSVTPRLLKQRNSTNTGWIIRARVDSDYGGTLPLIGGTMEGAINMGGYPITNLPAGAGNAPARYTDLAAYSKLDGSVPFTGIPSVPAQDPSLADQVARKDYVDRASRAGGSFSSQIVLPVAATASGHAVRKAEFDNAIDTHSHSGATGMGIKVPPGSMANLDDTHIGEMVRHTDSATVQWAPPISILDALGIQVINVTQATGATLVDVTAYVPRYARACLLMGVFHSQGIDLLNLFLRRDGTSSEVQWGSSFADNSFVSDNRTPALTIRELVIAPFNPATPTQKRFYFRTTRENNYGNPPPSIQAWLLGWI